MSFAIDIPHFYALLRSEYLYNQESHHGEYTPCCVFGADSVEGHAIGFDALTNFGGQFARLPISALCWRACEPQQLSVLELWNNFSYSFEAHEYAFLRQLKCAMWVPQETLWYPSEYMFTLSWFGSPYAEQPGEGGFKRAHILKLENGNFAAQPNNRIKWYEPSFVTKPFPATPDFKTNDFVWNAEHRKTPWSSEDSNDYFYGERDS